ncbi:MAG TPA: OsmC family peroxiredoxin [Terriglobales bacterium]|jgi:osmotically inducible protein OsmC|nr:OsmC family peroxiredoxin [Terriglobales bacterium]
MIRSAVAIWKGSPVIGEGLVSTTSGVISNALYAAAGSSTGGDPCTSPSEMLAAAVASCMSLMVALESAKVGLKPDHVRTESVLTLEEKKGRWEITGIQLRVSAGIQDADEEKFHKAIRSARARCPISRALKVPIKMTTKLEAVAHELSAV